MTEACYAASLSCFVECFHLKGLSIPYEPGNICLLLLITIFMPDSVYLTSLFFRKVKIQLITKTPYEKNIGSWGEICESANRACLEPCSRQAIGVVKIHGPHDWPHEPKYLRKIIFFWLFSPHLTIRYHRYISDYVSTCTYEFVSSCGYLQYDFCVVCGLLGVLISLCLA